MGNFDQAISYYDQALELDPDFVKALANKGVAVADQGDLETSLTYLDQAIEVEPDDYLNYYNKGTVLSDMGYKELTADGENGEAYAQEAIRMLDKAIELNPTYVDAYVYKAITYTDLQQYDQALEQTELALELYPEHENARYYQAVALAQLGRLADARAAYQRVLAINPDNEFAIAELAELQGDLGEE
jgi:tetratricopeptide (TPR) repeat protein